MPLRPVLSRAMSVSAQASTATASMDYLACRNMLSDRFDKGASKTLMRDKIDRKPLPMFLDEALLTNKSRAIVITEAKAPFRIESVNKAWEHLCGYNFLESKGMTLGRLLHGPETDVAAATGLVSKLLQGETVGTTLTNYTKSGRRFRNRVHLGPLYEDESKTKVTHYVGVLQEVDDGQ